MLLLNRRKTPPHSRSVAADIQRISISLTVQSTDAGIEFGGGQLKATMTSNVDLRNMGDSCKGQILNYKHQIVKGAIKILEAESEKVR